VVFLLPQLELEVLQLLFLLAVPANADGTLFPMLSCIQEIRYELGENSRTADWYRANHRKPLVERVG